MESPLLVLDAKAAVEKTTKVLSENATRRLTGVYYTPSSAADYMADWLVRYDGEHILEPSFGAGIFLQSVAASNQRRNFGHVHLTGVEIDRVVKAQAQERFVSLSADLHCADFLRVAPFPVQGIIGNPPYVRLRNLTDDQRERALEVAGSVMGEPMEPSGSVWMPFVLHSMRFLTTGGRMALVLPYELTYVRYARLLWDTLRSKFGSLQILRTHERLFPDILQDVVILLADQYGERTETVHYRAFERVDDLLENRSLAGEQIPIDDLLRGQRSFVEALLGPDLRQLLRGHIADVTVPARNLVTFNIGYVTGDKNFFHPTPEVIQKYCLPEASLHPAFTSTRGLKGAGIGTSSFNREEIDRLFLPGNHPLTAGERGYIEWGEENGVANRYKCQVRDPWYVVPGVRVPDVILSVFSERPVLLVNDAEYFASNSLLCGFSNGLTGAEIVARWYTSLTLLQCELEVHALGGGVMVLIPGEAGNIRLPHRVTAHEDHSKHLDCQLKQGKTIEAYQSGDKILIDQLGFSERDVDLIRHGIRVLAHWRTSSRSSLLPKTKRGS